MYKSNYNRILSVVMAAVMLLGVLPGTSLSAATEAIRQAEFFDLTPDLNLVIEKNSLGQAEMVAFAEGLVPGYGSNGKFLAPIETPDPTATPIYTAGDLDGIRTDLGGNFVLMNDIDLADYNSGQWEPIGDNSTNGDSSRFTGYFDGQGHVIKNLTITVETYQYAGLFGFSQNAFIKNLGLENTNIALSGSTTYSLPSVGGISGYTATNIGSGHVSISNCYNTGYISSLLDASIAGGISGTGNRSSITDCYNTGDISALYYAGGICGDGVGSSHIARCYNAGGISASSFAAGGIYGSSISSDSITSCYNIGDISAASPAGGISGSSTGPITNCYNTGEITSLIAGGIRGTGSGTITDCYNTGDISAYSSAGGISGSSSTSGSIANCYNLGDVSTSSSSTFYSYSGGICGNNNSNTITNCLVISKRIYEENNTDQNNTYSYLIGYGGTKSNNLAVNVVQGNISISDDSDGRITMAEAKKNATYEGILGWDFSSIWEMVPGYDYPQLQELPYFQPKTDPTFTVTFLSGTHGTMDPSPASEEVSYQRTVSSVPSIIPDEGYDFIGWESGIGGIYDAAAIKLYPVNGAITFTAQYVPKASSSDAIAFFDYNGGIIGTDTSGYKSGTPGATYVSPAPTRTGHNLSGWGPAGIWDFGGGG
ncbi:MAG: InlB B-repeat-containing protein, partial [Clostridiales bacterium]|nr:InlB B-repeat-containing protein [Clostridiales bacterium]